ncbi:MAG: LOG family protein, partial [Spirochaetota bacterium]
WQQLGYHDKPVALLNTSGYFDGLIAFMLHMAGSGFITPEKLSDLIVEKEPERLLPLLDR